MTVTELRSVLAPRGVDLDPTALEKLCAFAAIVVEQNKVQNLIGPATEPDLATRHFLDSLMPLSAGLLPCGSPEPSKRGSRTVESSPPQTLESSPLVTIGADSTGLGGGKSPASAHVPRGTLIDVGSGAGFPGLVLAIARPDLRVTLCDSLGKRCDFLRASAAKLDLPNVEVLNARAEELADRRESFDFATARAVTAMSALCELCLPLVKVGGTMLAYKTARAADEIAAASRAVKLLGGRLETPFDYEIDGAAMRLQAVRKISATPPAYPRAWGKIKSKPL